MRVIAGIAKGKKLYAPKGVDVRPTSDRVKESIFNIIGQRVIDLRVLDLFAGTGNLGIEALSRGAEIAYFVDSKQEAIRLINKNLEATGFLENAVVIRADVDNAIKRLSRDGLKFDLIFLDPPYRISVSFLDAILYMLASDILIDNGLLVLEHSAKNEPRVIDSIEIESTRIYGDTAVTFYKKGQK